MRSKLEIISLSVQIASETQDTKGVDVHCANTVAVLRNNQGFRELCGAKHARLWLVQNFHGSEVLQDTGFLWSVKGH